MNIKMGGFPFWVPVPLLQEPVRTKGADVKPGFEPVAFQKRSFPTTNTALLLNPLQKPKPVRSNFARSRRFPQRTWFGLRALNISWVLGEGLAQPEIWRLGAQQKRPKGSAGPARFLSPCGGSWCPSATALHGRRRPGRAAGSQGSSKSPVKCAASFFLREAWSDKKHGSGHALFVCPTVAMG